MGESLKYHTKDGKGTPLTWHKMVKFSPSYKTVACKSDKILGGSPSTANFTV